MSKAEKFIQDYTRNCSNEYLTDSKPDGLGGYISRRIFSPWLTPDQARKAVEIAREEMIEKVCKYLDEYLFELWEDSCPTIDDFIEKFKQAMQDE